VAIPDNAAAGSIVGFGWAPHAAALAYSLLGPCDGCRELRYRARPDAPDEVIVPAPERFLFGDDDRLYLFSEGGDVSVWAPEARVRTPVNRDAAPQPKRDAPRVPPAVVAPSPDYVVHAAVRGRIAVASYGVEAGAEMFDHHGLLVVDLETGATRILESWQAVAFPRFFAWTDGKLALMVNRVIFVMPFEVSLD
jgi:hypothetical protein